MWPEINKFTSSLEDAARLILTHFELDVPVQTDCSRSITPLDRLKLVSFAVSVLFFGLLSYVHGHIGDLDEIAFSQLEEEFVIHVAHKHVAPTRYRFECLHEFLGRPVWAFKCPVTE